MPTDHDRDAVDAWEAERLRQLGGGGVADGRDVIGIDVNAAQVGLRLGLRKRGDGQYKTNQSG